MTERTPNDCYQLLYYLEQMNDDDDDDDDKTPNKVKQTHESRD